MARCRAPARAHGLAPPALQPGSLPGALSNLARRVRRAYGIRRQFRKHIAAPLQLDTTQANHLYRIAQVGVNKAVRHGRATFITLRLAADARSIALTVTDNGRGIPRTRQASPGMGLRIMEYRARMLDGTLRIESPRRGGTAIRCCVSVSPTR